MPRSFPFPHRMPGALGRGWLSHLLLLLVALGGPRLSAAIMPTNWVAAWPTGLRAQVTSLQGPVKEAVFAGIAQAVHTVFLWAIPATVLVFLLALLIKEVPLRGRSTPGDEVPAPEAEALIG